MLHWVAAFLGFEPIKNLGPQDSMSSQTNYKSNAGQINWPEGLQTLECQGCGMVVHPKMSTGGMKAQLEQKCPDGNCDGILWWVTCNARTYHFTIKEDGIEYSVWKHTGSHSSHPHPPCGQQPPGIHGAPDEARASASQM